MSSPDLRERRLEHRIQVNLPARSTSRLATLEGRVANMSRTGVFLRSQFLDDPGNEVDLNFQLPGDPQPVSVHGRVVRVDDRAQCPGMAIQFIRVSDAARTRLALFMGRRRNATRPPSQMEL